MRQFSRNWQKEKQKGVVENLKETLIYRNKLHEMISPQ